MNIWLRFNLFLSLPFHFSDWLHVDFIGNQIDLILSLRLQNLSISWHANNLHICLCLHKLLCQLYVTRHLLILTLNTYYNSVWLDTWTCSTSTIHSVLKLAWQCLVAWHLSDSILTIFLSGLTPIATRHLYYTRHILLDQHELSK